ncbi:YceI family protein [Rhizohabitans arisaemae]|uniref:YceI family protein n=1 Tax=Rhizohabitans arisaemae TaxID=2720610 RepID=UPI0024B04688|nr:YceI family protein [Rhizohabitans arisaemae]
MEYTRTIEGRLMPIPGAWVFVHGTSSAGFLMRHLGIAKLRGTFRAFAGIIDVGETLHDTTVSLGIEASSVDTGLSARDAAMRDEDFFNVAAHPLITYRSTKTHVTEDGDLEIHGHLTIAGVTQPAVLGLDFLGVVSVHTGEYRAVFSATTMIDRLDFGLVYNKTLDTGGKILGTQIKLELEILAVRQDSPVHTHGD